MAFSFVSFVTDTFDTSCRHGKQIPCILTLLRLTWSMPKAQPVRQ